MSLDEKKKRSDYVIENDGNIQNLERKIDEFLKKVEFENKTEKIE